VKKFYAEFKDFINNGDVVMTAVALVMALTFKAVIDAIIAGVINPIIAAIFGKPNLDAVGFTVNNAFFSIGKVVEAAISFIAVAFILFLIVKAYNTFKKKEAAVDPAPTEIDLLTEIRDSLRNR
jgi:large conductance mechanosensitive channel